MIGWLALLVSLLTWTEYLGRIPKEAVPRRPIAHGALQAVALALGAWALTQPSSRVAGGFAVVLAGFFLWLLTQARMPEGRLRVGIGDAMIPFSAVTAEGSPFDSNDLAGQRVLLKFFRGHW